MSEKVLVVEDDPALAAMLGEYLGGRGFAVTACTSGERALERCAREPFDAMVLDLTLPGIDGLEVLRRLRAGGDLPVIVLTARGEDTDRIVGLEIGADDYLAKPFNPRELAARLAAVLRRRSAGAPRPRLLRFGRLEIDADAREARVDGVVRPLTGYQFDLLWTLAGHAGRVMSRQALLDALRGDQLELYDRSLDVHVSRIRAAIEDDPRAPRRIVTVRGAGYLFARRQDGEGA